MYSRRDQRPSEEEDFFANLLALETIPEEIADNHLSADRKFFVDLNNDRNLQEIKQCIVSLIQRQPFWGEYHPTSWVYFERKVEEIKKTKKVIYTEELWDENKKMADEMRFKKADDMRPMLRFFHDLGIVLYFDEEYLRDLIVLDVQWFVDTFKYIITDENHAKDLHAIREWKYFNQTGELGEDLLDEIWMQRNQEYIKHKPRILLYMERLGILAQMKNRKTASKKSWYVPCVNKLSFPSNDFKAYTLSSIMCFQFAFLPSVIFYRLITGCMNILKFNIVQEDNNPSIYQTATLLNTSNQESHYILIGMQENAIEIQILVPPGHKYNKEVGIAAKDKIANILDDITRTFHSNLKDVDIGIKCKKGVFGQYNSHFIHLTTVETITAYDCNKCKFKDRQKIDVQKFLSHWFKDGKVPTVNNLAEYCEKCLKKVYAHKKTTTESPTSSEKSLKKDPTTESQAFSDSVLSESYVADGAKQERSFKGDITCCLLGDSCVGKTAIYHPDPYNQMYTPTTFDMKFDLSVLVDDDEYNLRLIDTSGNEGYANLRQLCYESSDVFIICFSIESESTFLNVEEKWLPEIRTRFPDVPFILVGTKSDVRSDPKKIQELRQRDGQDWTPLHFRKGKDLAEKRNAARYMECSGLTKEGVEELYKEAVRISIQSKKKKKGKKFWKR